MLSRMNFAATLAANQRFNLARDAAALPPDARNACSNTCSRRFRTMGFNSTQTQAMLDYLRSARVDGNGCAAAAASIPGLTRLIVGAGEYAVQLTAETQRRRGQHEFLDDVNSSRAA